MNNYLVFSQSTSLRSGVYVSGESTFTMEGGTITGNGNQMNVEAGSVFNSTGGVVVD